MQVAEARNLGAAEEAPFGEVGAVRRLSCAQCLSSRRGRVTHACVASHYAQTSKGGLVLMPASCVRARNDPTMTHGFY